MANRVSKGMRFRSVHADSNPLWEVKQSLGKGAWKCVVVNEPIKVGDKTYDGEWAGMEKAFLSKDILAAAGMSQMFEKLHDEQDRWYNAQPLGTIVHYHNGFNNFVRCEIVFDHPKCGAAQTPEPKQKLLKPIALVGKWGPGELAKYGPTGKVEYGYHARCIMDGECWRASITCIYEHPSCRANLDDPRRMAPLDIVNPPPMNDQKKLTAAAVAKLEQVRALVNHDAFQGCWQKGMTEDEANRAYELAIGVQLGKVLELLKAA